MKNPLAAEVVNLLTASRFKWCRGDRIRTCDHLVPNQVRYRTALRPDALAKTVLPNASAKLVTILALCKFLWENVADAQLFFDYPDYIFHFNGRLLARSHVFNGYRVGSQFTVSDHSYVSGIQCVCSAHLFLHLSGIGIYFG